MKEEFFGFRKIKGYSDSYLVNRNGDVFSVKTMQYVTHCNVRGYSKVHIGGKSVSVHRLVMETFSPKSGMKKLHVNHMDKNTSNNHIDNLQWTTAKENVNWNKKNKTLSFRDPKINLKIINLENEVWQDVIGYEGFYQVSNRGRIKSLRKNIRGRWIGEEVLFKCNPRKDGYVRVQLKKDGISKGYYLHRIVAVNFIFNSEHKKQVNHKNGIRDDNRVENLEWCTPQENTQYSIKHLGRDQRGEKSPQSKLTEQNVRDIRGLYSEKGFTLTQIAKAYNVHYSTIGYAINGKNWSHLK